MSFENIKNLLNNKTITWETIRNELKAMKADTATIDKMRSIFYALDVKKDRCLSTEELKNAFALLNAMDSDKNGKISNAELKASGNGQAFGTENADDLNQFITTIQTITNVSKDNPESASSLTSSSAETVNPTDSKQVQNTETTAASNNVEQNEDLSETKQDQKSAEAKQQALTEYTVQPGDTPEKIAKKFGLTGEDAKEFIDHLKKQTNQKGWFIVGQKITLLGDHTEALKNMSGYTEDKTELNNRWANTDAGKKAIENAKSSNQNSPVSESNLPKSIQDRIASLKQSGDSYEITGDAQKGYTIKVTSGKYMNQHKIGLIEMQYDSAGNLQTYTQKYNNGQINETTYTGGKKTKVIAPIIFHIGMIL